jgi:hypothetical protein
MGKPKDHETKPLAVPRTLWCRGKSSSTWVVSWYMAPNVSFGATRALLREKITRLTASVQGAAVLSFLAPYQAARARAKKTPSEKLGVIYLLCQIQRKKSKRINLLYFQILRVTPGSTIDTTPPSLMRQLSYFLYREARNRARRTSLLSRPNSAKAIMLRQLFVIYLGRTSSRRTHSSIFFAPSGVAKYSPSGNCVLAKASLAWPTAFRRGQVFTQGQLADRLDRIATYRIPTAEPFQIIGIKPGFRTIPESVTKHTLVGTSSFSYLRHARPPWEYRSTTFCKDVFFSSITARGTPCLCDGVYSPWRSCHTLKRRGAGDAIS